MRHLKSSLPWALSIGFAACTSGTPDPIAGGGPGIRVNVSPLTLAGVKDACYGLYVQNGAGDLVAYLPHLCSSQYGNGPDGDLSYVVPCDAQTTPTGNANNTVTLVLEGIDTDASAATAWLDETQYRNPCGWPDPAGPGQALATVGSLSLPLDSDPPYAGPGADAAVNWDGFSCQRVVSCRENADAPVTFNLTVMRDADQGFFDVAVSFEDIFCSAKVDCAYPDGRAIELVFDPETSERVQTVVWAFACTDGDPAGTDATTATHLYMDDLVLDCDDGSAYTIPAAGGPGNAYPDAGTPAAPIVQAMVFEGIELIRNGALDADKLYWNVALGLDMGFFTSGDAPNCTLRTRATASRGPLAGGTTPANTRYPMVEVAVPINDGGAITCTQHGLDQSGDHAGVATSYTGMLADLSGFATTTLANEATSGGGAIDTHPVAGAPGCGAIVCGTHAQCVDDALGARCACDAGYTGDPDAGCTPIEPAPVAFTTLGGGDSHVCGVREDGSLWCWGANVAGQLGLGDTLIRTSPTRVDLRTDWVAVAPGRRHTCALDADGAVWCWGENSWGELGVGDNASRSGPTRVVGVDGVVFTAVFASYSASCALSDGGDLYCWGANDSGQVGVGHQDPVTAPARVILGSDWVGVAIGERHKCALDVVGALYCWGDGSRGQAALPAPPAPECAVYSGDEWACLDAGCIYQGFACLACSDLQDPWTCMQTSGCTYTGDGCAPDNGGSGGRQSSEPAQVGSDTDWRVVDAIADTTCALKLDGSRWCWGANDYNIQGPSNGDVFEPTRVDGRNDWADLRLGGYHACGLVDDGSLECWASNDFGEAGDGTTISPVTDPVTVAGGHLDWSAPVLGYNYTCALRAGAAWCWGTNASGELGLGLDVVKLAPEQVHPASDWIAVSVGDAHTCGIRAAAPDATQGTLWCAGANNYGQLGDGSTAGRQVFVQEGVGRTDWSVVAAGHSFTQALAAGGQRWAFGFSSKLGAGAVAHQSLPLRADTDTWSAIAAGNTNGCGLRAGELWCWGDNGYYSVGDGTQTHRLSPVRVGTDSGWTFTSLGSQPMSHGIRGGQLLGWGWNQWGWLGVGFSSPSYPYAITSPSVIGGSSSWSQLDTGKVHSCGVQAPGTAWCWGSNKDGQLGTGAPYTDFDHPAPTRVGSDADWARLVVANTTTCGLKQDGSLWCWGNNSTGAVGDGSGANRTTPVPVASGASWIALASGGSTSICAIRDDHTLWCWGREANGEHGDDALLRATPAQVL